MRITALSIPTLYAIETNIRSIAFSHHAVWVEKAKKNRREGLVCAIYYEPYTNRVYPDTLDAIFVEIIDKQTGYYISGFAIIPEAAREEIKIHEWHYDYVEAKQAANRWIISVHKLVSKY